MSMSLFLSMIAAVILSFFIPILLWGRFGFRAKGFFTTVLIGAASYLAYNVAIGRTVLMYISGMEPLAQCLIAAISYAIGLTLMNYVSYRIYTLITKDPSCFFAVGAGQALAESAMTVGIAYINNIFFSVLIMHGTFEGHMSGIGVDIATIEMIESTLTSLPKSSLFLSAFERMFFSIVLITAHLFLAKYLSQGKTLKGLCISTLALYSAYLIPGLLSLSSDESLVYVTMSMLAVLSIAVVWFIGRRINSKVVFQSSLA